MADDTAVQQRPDDPAHVPIPSNTPSPSVSSGSSGLAKAYSLSMYGYPSSRTLTTSTETNSIMAVNETSGGSFSTAPPDGSATSPGSTPSGSVNSPQGPQNPAFASQEKGETPVATFRSDPPVTFGDEPLPKSDSSASITAKRTNLTSPGGIGTIQSQIFPSKPPLADSPRSDKQEFRPVEDGDPLYAATYIPDAGNFVFDTHRPPAASPLRESSQSPPKRLTAAEKQERRLTKTQGEIREALDLELPVQPAISSDIPSGRRRHNNQDVLKALLKIVEGGSKPLETEKPVPGRLVVDQTLPVPRLFEVKKKVFRLSESGGSSERFGS